MQNCVGRLFRNSRALDATGLGGPTTRRVARLIALDENEGLRVVILRNGAVHVLGKRAQVPQRPRVDVASDHPRWEDIAHLIKPQREDRAR
jgi:hypothetical protein